MHVIRIIILGNKLVLWRDNFDVRICNAERYQPFNYKSYPSGLCIFQRSICNEIGQVIYNNGTNVVDRVCRCDYTKGFAFVSEPHNRCYCILSKEDCTCYKKQCSGSELLTPGMCTIIKFIKLFISDFSRYCIVYEQNRCIWIRFKSGIR